MEYRRNYVGFVLWLLVFFGLMLGTSALPIENEALLTRLTLLVCSALITALAFMIWRNEHVYWYNGISYEEARQADSERRRRYAWRHFVRFGWFALLYALFSLLAQLAGVGIGWDIAVFAAGLLGTAISTISIKL